MARKLLLENVKYIAAGNGSRIIWKKWESKIILI